MSLIHEATIVKPGYQAGDVKIAHYDIPFTQYEVVEPTNDLGWFLLNGAVLSQTTYPVLFARYGTTFNTGGEGAGNFRLPNHTEGAFPIAAGLTNFTSYGVRGGEINHLLSSSEMPYHNHADSLTISANAHGHSASITAVNQGTTAHTYSIGQTGTLTPSGSFSQINYIASWVASSTAGTSHAHTVTSLSIGGTVETFTKSGSLASSGSNAPHNNMMPFIVIGGLLVKYG